MTIKITAIWTAETFERHLTTIKKMAKKIRDADTDISRDPPEFLKLRKMCRELESSCEVVIQNRSICLVTIRDGELLHLLNQIGAITIYGANELPTYGHWPADPKGAQKFGAFGLAAYKPPNAPPLRL